jgi:crossover junction endodeoxyribonuclease RuvC
MRIIGIDPGYARVGYGLVEVSGNDYRCETRGVIEIAPRASPERLAELETKLTALFVNTHPDRIGIERLFFVRNKTSGIAVAEARGVILLTAGKVGIPIFELSPTMVKRAVTGNGTASKPAVAKMVRWVLHLEEVRELDDATDALAIAIAAAGAPQG